MASVINYEVLEDNVSDQQGRRDIRILFTVEDNNAVSHEYNKIYVRQPADTDVDDFAVAQGAVLLSSLANEEKEISVQDMAEEDPLHVFTTFWQKQTPDWNTWNDLFIHVSHYFWSLENKLDILPFRDCWGRVSSQDKSNLLGIAIPDVGDMNGDMQTAYDTWVSLSSYTPYFDQDGTWLGS